MSSAFPSSPARPGFRPLPEDRSRTGVRALAPRRVLFHSSVTPSSTPRAKTSVSPTVSLVPVWPMSRLTARISSLMIGREIASGTPRRKEPAATARASSITVLPLPLSPIKSEKRGASGRLHSLKQRNPFLLGPGDGDEVRARPPALDDFVGDSLVSELEVSLRLEIGRVEDRVFDNRIGHRANPRISEDPHDSVPAIRGRNPGYTYMIPGACEN